MTPQERTIYNSLLMILHTTPYSIALQLMTEDLPPSSKTQYKKKINSVYDKYIDGKVYYKAKELEDLMKTIGWEV